ncbi:MAG: hypothetical protein AAB576_02460, partial [Elusimicrobiota bacterium]
DDGARGGFGFGSREFAQLALGLSYRARRLGVDTASPFPSRASPAPRVRTASPSVSASAGPPMKRRARR